MMYEKDRKKSSTSDPFTRRYSTAFSHINAFTDRRFTHRRFYTQTPLHTDTFTNRCFYTDASTPWFTLRQIEQKPQEERNGVLRPNLKWIQDGFPHACNL